MDIDPDKLFGDIKLTFTPNTNGSEKTVTFSPTSYILLALDRNDDDLKNLVTALYRYTQKASEYNSQPNWI